jgi:putative sigma-54 modulation protein
MRVELTGRHVEITPPLRRLVDKKLLRLERILNDSALSAEVVLTREKNGRRVDIALHARGERFLHGVGASNNWAVSTTQAIDKISQQAQRVKGKWQARKRGGRRSPPNGAGEADVARVGRAVQPPRVRPRMPPILRASRQAVKAMSVAEAAREVGATDEGLIVFRDAETAVLSVLFRRTNGELTLIETEP